MKQLPSHDSRSRTTLYSTFHVCAWLDCTTIVKHPRRRVVQAVVGPVVMSGMGSDIDDVLEDIAESEGLLLGQS